MFKEDVNIPRRATLELRPEKQIGKILLKLRVNKCILGIFQGIQIKQPNDILRQIMPEKLLRTIPACKYLFEKLVM